VFNLHGGCMDWGVLEEVEWLTPDPVSAAPITGATDPCEVGFYFHN